MTRPELGLLVVHGIGEQQPGETTEKVVAGLRDVYGDRLRVERDARGVAVRAALGERTVGLYEVHWADILGSARVRGTFRWDVVHALAWFPWLNWRAGLLRPPEYSRTLVVAWTLLLIPATLALSFVFWGARFLAQVAQDVRRPAAHGLSWKAAREQARRAVEERTVVEDVLDSYAGDVINYLASLCGVVFAARPGIGTAAADVLARFYAQLEAARRDGCGEIHVLAHSLGTVVAFHALAGPCETVGITRLYTIGSPLEKIRFFWPATMTIPAWRVRWDNFHHRFDPVAGSLRRFESWGGVVNHSLLTGGGLLRSHVVYERSATFLRVLTEGLFGAPAAPARTAWRHAADVTVSVAENLLTPVLIAALWAIGAALGMFALLLPGFLLSLPARAIGADAWVEAIQTGVAVMMLIPIAYVSTVRVRRQARTWHERWTAHPPLHMDVAARP